MTVETLPSVRGAVDLSSFRPKAARAVKAPVSSVVQGPPNAFAQINGLMQSYSSMAYMLPFEILDYIELLAKWNSDYSQAVDNIKTLANSGHELFVDADSDLQRRRISDLLEVKAGMIQERNGGIDGLIDKLLDQASVYGAMCGEWVVSEDLTEVVDFAEINPKFIRFFWSFELQRYLPFQKVTGSQLEEARERGQLTINGCVALNELTFHYYAFDAAAQNPYGVPPFIAALAPIATQRDMLGNMAQIVKKVGLLGIIDIVVKQLPPVAGETPEQYQTRAGAYLDEYVEVTENMVRDGGIVHFDDVEVTSTQITGNAAGATNIFKQNEEQVFSGLKSMPSVQGRSYSTTETYAGVAYDIIIRNTMKYQRACKRMIENGYWLMSTLAALQPKKISLNFNPNKTLHRLQDAQSEAMELHNGLVLWVTGVIDQTGFAQRQGFADVKVPMEDPPESQIIQNAGNVASGGKTNDGGNQDPAGGGKPDNQNNN
jgi:hypothetical protein